MSLLFLLERAAAACAVCYGQAPSEGGLVKGFLLAMTVMLVSTFALLGGIGWMLWKVEKAREAAEA
jgi:hypothetical protein